MAREPRTIMANLVNDVMIDCPPASYARAMAVVTPRKLWQAEPGDCVVALAPCDPAFRDYVASVVDVPADTVDVVAPSALFPGHPLDVVAALDATPTVTARPQLAPFVVDARVVDFARSRRLRLADYPSLPEERTLTAIRRINTKAGFREIATEMGLPVADGGHAYAPADLAEQLTRFLHTRERAIVKVNRSSNGHGTFEVTAADIDLVPHQIRRSVAEAPARRCGWVYEERMAFTAVPSIELFLDGAGVHAFYTCDQRTRDNAWTGMVTPAVTAEPQVVEAAHRIGGWLHRHGFRGYADVDAGVHPGGFVVTEANVRRTGGTYLEELARRLHPGPAQAAVHWRADVRPGTNRLDFHRAVKALAHAGLAERAAPARATLLVDTLKVDGKWRYLVSGHTAEAVAAVENELTDILELV
ncbi:peptide ligase PGM1-related protein [Solwaraspora sp. WMMA2065]|uniref:preATP grasp domain-containing protein n=1 Tax=Solwaraspora sp. WMMA2065 TaxID=3015166 RepID=UPI00259B19E6|nr:peptide ligase PGM1-related protein [Solwaraspora sp. WMMA2065]WJK33073.1 peptide ligase PGM1-related protein [Solwaraspora sp. WMMA2065]